MYERITDENPYEVPMRIYPAPHYTMGGLWVDYDLMTTVPGLYALGEANFSDHGANRLGASALMQGLADGYFVLPYTIGNYLAPLLGTKPVPTDHPAFQAAEAEVARALRRLPRHQGHPLGRLLPPRARQDHVGLLRHGAHRARASRRRSSEIPALHEEFRKDLRVLGDGAVVNQSLEKAGRVDDFFELAQLMCRDALDRDESLRRPLPRRVPDRGRRGAARRRALRLRRARGSGPATRRTPELHKEPLEFENVHLAERSYK